LVFWVGPARVALRLPLVTDIQVVLAAAIGSLAISLVSDAGVNVRNLGKVTAQHLLVCSSIVSDFSKLIPLLR